MKYSLAVASSILAGLVSSSVGENFFNKGDSQVLKDFVKYSKFNEWDVKDCCECSVPVGPCKSFCKGIECRDSRVVSFEVPSYKVSIPIPESLYNLTALNSLNLSPAAFTSPLSNKIEQLSNLVRLGFGFQSFSGSFAPLGNLRNLQYLNLEGAYSSESLKTLEYASTIKELRFSRVYSDAMPETISNLKDLEKLTFDKCEIRNSFIPSSFGKLSKLKELTALISQFAGTIPDAIFDIPSISKVSFHFNSLSGSIPSNIGNAKNLVELKLYDNYLTGEIPFSIGKLEKIERIVLTRNKLTGSLPSSLIGLSSVREIFFDDNSLTGTIPDFIFKLSKIQSFYLTGNQLSGTIPESLGEAVKLIDLSMSDNKFTGTIPSSIGNLIKLQSINLARNKLEGTIPASIGNIKKLASLILTSNQLVGNVPESLRTVENLKTLLVGNNLLGCPVVDYSSWGNYTDRSLYPDVNSSYPRCPPGHACYTVTPGRGEKPYYFCDA